MQFITIIIYALISVSGLTLIKLGSANPLSIGVGQSGLSFNIGWVTLCGFALYVASFLIYMGLVSKSNLSYLTPVSSAVVYVLTLIVSLVIFKEQMTAQQWAGWCLILVGVVLMNLKK